MEILTDNQAYTYASVRRIGGIVDVDRHLSVLADRKSVV